MISTSLHENIYRLVNRWGCVKVSQIVKMFSKHSLGSIEYHIRNMIFSGLIVLDEDGNVCAKHRYPYNKAEKERRLTALSVLCNFGEDKIRESYPCEYPITMIFVTEDNKVYDVTVVDYNNYSALLGLLPIIREKYIDPAYEDEVIHIAIVPDENMIPKITKLSFDLFCILDENDDPQYYTVEND